MYREDRKNNPLMYVGEQRRNAGNVCFVGNLPHDVRKNELYDLFEHCKSVDIERSRGGSTRSMIAYVSFQSRSDAERAIRGRNRIKFGGQTIRVELANSHRPLQINYAEDCAHRLWVRNLPERCSWQDLKDFFREYGSIRHTNVIMREYGVIEYHSERDVPRAVDKTDGQEFRTRSGSTSTIAVSKKIPKQLLELCDEPRNGRSRRDRSYSRSRSRGRRSVSRDNKRDRKRSVSRSRSRDERSRRTDENSSSRKRSKSVDADDDRKRRESRSDGSDRREKKRHRSRSRTPRKRSPAARRKKSSRSNSRARSESGEKEREASVDKKEARRERSASSDVTIDKANSDRSSEAEYESDRTPASAAQSRASERERSGTPVREEYEEDDEQ